MNDNEMDDLFRRNADYLADQPPRDFDQAAFWQQLQAELPKKTEPRKKPAAWWWAAASVLLAGMLGGVWWMQSAEVKTTAESETLRLSEAGIGSNRVPYSTKVGPLRGRTQPQPWSVSPQTRVAKVPGGGTSIRHRPRTPEILAKKEKRQTALPAPPERELVKAMQSPAALLPTIENNLTLPEVVAPALPEKPAYRVVHINEIRDRKQQEAKARSRVAVRIGLPSGSRLTTQNNSQPLLNIPIQH